jgi:hypothetical protein
MANFMENLRNLAARSGMNPAQMTAPEILRAAAALTAIVVTAIVTTYITTQHLRIDDGYGHYAEMEWAGSNAQSVKMFIPTPIGTNVTLAFTDHAQTFTARQKFVDMMIQANEHSLALKAPAALAGDLDLTLPGTNGANGNVLTTDGAGMMSWAAATVYETAGSTATHAALTTGVHGLAITEGQTLTVTTGGTIGTAAYTASTAYKPVAGVEDVAHGGTGVETTTVYAPIFGGTTTTGALQSGAVGTAGQVLTSNGAGALPTFQAPAGGGMTIVYKTATETVQNSTVLQNDDELLFAMEANKIYVGKMVLHCLPNDTAGLKFMLSGPANPTFVKAWSIEINNQVAGLSGQHQMEDYTNPHASTPATSGVSIIIIEFTISNGANAGNLNLQWSQNTSNNQVTRVYLGSYIQYQKVN